MNFFSFLCSKSVFYKLGFKWENEKSRNGIGVIRSLTYRLSAVSLKSELSLKLVTFARDKLPRTIFFIAEGYFK